MTESLARREFVAAAAVIGIGVAATGLAGCASPDGSGRAKVATLSTRYGEKAPMGK